MYKDMDMVHTIKVADSVGQVMVKDIRRGDSKEDSKREDLWKEKDWQTKTCLLYTSRCV